MEAKPITGEHCRFCGPIPKMPLVKTPCFSSGYIAIHPLCRFEAAGAAKSSMSALACVIPHYEGRHGGPWEAARNAGISGSHEITNFYAENPINWPRY